MELHTIKDGDIIITSNGLFVYNSDENKLLRLFREETATDKLKNFSKSLPKQNWNDIVSAVEIKKVFKSDE